MDHGGQGMVDLLVTAFERGLGEYEAAQALGVSPGWVRMIQSSDAFAERRAMWRGDRNAES